MKKPILEVFLHEVYPRLAPYWDGKPYVYVSYNCPSGGGGTCDLGRLNTPIGEISKCLIEKLKEIWLPKGTKIHFWNGEQRRIHIEPGEVIAPPLTRRLDEIKYKEILSYLRKQYPEFSFKTAMKN